MDATQVRMLTEGLHPGRRFRIVWNRREHAPDELYQAIGLGVFQRVTKDFSPEEWRNGCAVEDLLWTERSSEFDLAAHAGHMITLEVVVVHMGVVQLTSAWSGQFRRPCVVAKTSDVRADQVISLAQEIGATFEADGPRLVMYFQHNPNRNAGPELFTEQGIRSFFARSLTNSATA